MNPLTHVKKMRILPPLIALVLVAWAAGAAQAAISDFNGDGHPDFVLQNACTRQTAIWYLNNNIFISGAYGPTLVAGWYILAGVADFNRDGHPDYLLLDSGISPDTAIWYLSGPTLVGTARGPSVPRVPSGWGWGVPATLTATATRIMCFITPRRVRQRYGISITMFTQRGCGPTLPAGWFLVGVADFNRDGHTDYALEQRHAPNSDLVFIRTNVHRERLWADYPQRLGHW